MEGMLGCDMVGFHTEDYCLNFLDCCFLWAGWTNTAPTLPRVTSRHQLLSQVQCVNLRNNQKSPERGNNWSRPIIGQTWPYLKTVHSLSNAFWPPSPSRSSRKGTYIEPDNRKFCKGRQPIQKLESVFTVDIVYTIFFERWIFVLVLSENNNNITETWLSHQVQTNPGDQ